MSVSPEDVHWTITPRARRHFDSIRGAIDLPRLKATLCAYFSTAHGCHARALGISPLGATDDGYKKLKMRWNSPGCGKSGGLRLAIVADCVFHAVTLVAVFVRKNDPSDADFDKAFGKT